MDILIAHLKLTHPFTSLAVTVMTIILVLPVHAPLNSYRLFLVALVMLLVQLSIGVSNDLLDRPYDRIAKPWKPIPSGKVKLRTAIIVYFTLVVCSFVLGSLFGWLPFGIMLLGLCCGLAYNLGLKRTPLSWVPFSLAIPTLVLWARVINGDVPIVLLWVYPLGLLLGPALNLANQLVGAEEARDSGEHSLIHFLGVVKGRRVAVGLFILVSVFMPIVVWINHLQVEVAVVGSLVAFFFIAIFTVIAELDHRLALWPLAILIASLQGVFFLLAI